ncbi:hypothetical protein ACFFK0_04495 [Paenibacillus chartarius]|uniref:Uncharacterized protein n=1 Tax=Paenibacillus chartarius TaxID=747481 RepID=A0ABV6DGG6_9BACL
MRTWTAVGRMGAAAAALFALNGLINYRLMLPREGEPAAVRALRFHADEGVFGLIFLLAALLFAGMYRVQMKEKGYLYLIGFCLLSAAQLAAEWDEKELLFGPFPYWPYFSLVVKNGIVLLAVLFSQHLLQTGRRPANRLLTMLGALLLLVTTGAAVASAPDVLLLWCNRLFLLLVLASIAVNLPQFMALFRQGGRRDELRGRRTCWQPFRCIRC